MSLRPLSVLAGVLMVGALVGCSPTAPTPDPSPTAVALSNDELLEQFAEALCPAVIAEEAFADVWLNQTSTLEEIVAVAATARDEDTVTAEAMVAFTESWPEEFHADLALVEDLYTGKSADYAQIAEATSLAPLTTFEFGDVTDGNAAVQRIADGLETESLGCG
jgi:hypothetical protein